MRRPSRLERLSDGDLARRYLSGSEGAGAVLAERHWSGAWRAAYAVLGDRSAADDAAQAAAERAFRDLARFDVSRPFGPWLNRIAVNQALNSLRQRRHEAPLVDEYAAVDLYPDIAARDELIGVIGRLPDEQRLVVVLRYWADMTPAEIAAALEVPVGTVSSRLARALGALRTALAEVTQP